MMFLIRYACVGLALSLSLGMVSMTLATILSLIVCVFLIISNRLPVLIYSLAVFGYYLFIAISIFTGIKLTVLVAALNVPLAIYCLANYQTKFQSAGVSRFLFVWILFLVLFSFNVLIGPQSEYSLLVWQYLIVWGNFYVLSGVVVAKSNVSIREVLPLGAAWFSFLYPLIDATLFKVSLISDETIGLRGREGLDAISTARLAGFLLVSVFAFVLFDKKKLLSIPDALVAILVAIPIAWFSYTRQVYAGFAITLLAMVAYFLFSSRQTANSSNKMLVLISIFVVIVGIVYLFWGQVANSEGSRIGQDGFGINRLPLWALGVDMIAKDPFVGYGVGGFQAAGHGVWPHNWFLEAWIEHGLVGLMLFVFLTVVFLRATFGGKTPHHLVPWLFLGLYFFIVMQVSADIPRNSSFWFFLCLAFHTYWIKSSSADLQLNNQISNNPAINKIKFNVI